MDQYLPSFLCPHGDERVAGQDSDGSLSRGSRTAMNAALDSLANQDGRLGSLLTLATARLELQVDKWIAPR